MGNASTRNLVDSDIGPLRRFTGVFGGYTEESKKYGDESKGEKVRTSVQITLNFADIEILESVETYAFPTYSLVMNKSNRRKSQWGYFSDGKANDKNVGFNNIADMQYNPDQLNPDHPDYIKPQNRMDLDQAVGKRLGLVLADGDDGRPKPPDLFDGRVNEGKGGDAPRPSWTVYSIEGVGMASGGKTPLDKAMELLDGKSINEFNSAALADELVRSDMDLFQSISKPLTSADSFANVMVTTKQFIKDDQEVYHKADLPF